MIVVRKGNYKTNAVHDKFIAEDAPQYINIAGASRKSFKNFRDNDDIENGPWDAVIREIESLVRGLAQIGFYKFLEKKAGF